jgi:predicted nucleotide-binding protein (sugar kinase/HSP70/actin superfamily)
LAAALTDNAGLSSDKLLTPLIHYLYHSFHTKAELYRMLSRITDRKIGYFEVASAFEKALEFKADACHELKEVYIQEAESDDRLHVVLLGRPYSVLAKSMNKKIPHIFSSLGIKVFFQDMLTVEEEDVLPLRDRLDEFQWYFAKQILQAASVVARSRSAYPVLITSFKCSPDSFLIEQFRELMEAHQKPYLVLQLDEHDSSVGYETRIEAAIESFRNHFGVASEPVAERVQDSLHLDAPQKVALDGKTLLLPSWDELTFRLVAAVLRREGIDARLLEGKPASIRKSLRANTGQCTPLSLIAQEFIDYVEEHSLDPAKSALWVVRSNIACNICMYPHHIRKALQSYGGKLAEASVYAGNVSFMDLSVRLPIDIYFAYMFGGFLRKMACRVRPYECQRGSTDRAVSEAIQILEEAELEGRGKEEAVRQVVSLFKAIKTQFTRRPKVAIFGDLYVRDNDFINQGLVHFIEDNGGEVVTTPYSALIKMVSTPYLRKWIIEGELLAAVSSKAFLAMASRLEWTYLRHFREVLGDPEPPFSDSAEKVLSEYNVRLEHTGESMENLLKLHYIKKHHPDISLFVQASPAFCCPSLVTEAMAHRIEQSTGVPVVSVTYDGTGGNKNEAIIPYLKCRRPAGPSKLHQIL